MITAERLMYFNSILPSQDAEFLESKLLLHLLIFILKAQYLEHSEYFINVY